jgi:hypothetical protein
MGIVVVAAFAEIVAQMLPPVINVATGRLTSSTAMGAAIARHGRPPSDIQYDILAFDKRHSGLR